MLIAIFVLLAIALATRILKLKLLFSLQYDEGKKGLHFIVLIFNIKVLDYEFTVGADDDKRLIIKQYKRGKVKKEYTVKTLTKKAKRLFKEYKSSFDLVEKKLFDTFKKFFSKRVRIEELSLLIKLGLSDAFSTALVIGALYAAVNTMLIMLHEKKKPEKAEVNIKPDFQKALFEGNFTINISVRVSALFTIGAAAGFLFLKNRAREKHT